MNPWLIQDKQQQQQQLSTTSSEQQQQQIEETTRQQFEDNFQPPLPDSNDYLASLERKLKNLKKKHSSKDLVKSLAERKDDCMLRLLTENSIKTNEQDLKLDTPINNNQILRIISPEQAINLGELVELLKADQLAQVLAAAAEEEEQKCGI